MATKARILFLCTGNACRSQMAEGFARALLADRVEPYSAGLEARGLDPRAVAVMGEAGVDISAQRSKTLESLAGESFDLVVTVCAPADQHCPAFPAPTKVRHIAFDDPPKLAEAARSEEEALAHYRRVRDEVRSFIQDLPELLGT